MRWKAKRHRLNSEQSTLERLEELQVQQVRQQRQIAQRLNGAKGELQMS
jgi:hypothetical protein